MDESGAISFGVNLFEIDDELGRVMLSIRKHFGAKEGDDMVRNDLDGLVAEVGVIDTEVAVKPLDLVHYELAGNETLEEERAIEMSVPTRERQARTFAATVSWTLERCSALPLNTGVVYPGRFLMRWRDTSLPRRDEGSEMYGPLPCTCRVSLDGSRFGEDAWAAGLGGVADMDVR